MAYETLLVERDGAVAILTLNRPRRLNALNVRMDIELRHALVTLDAEPDIRVIVVTGAGRAFCMGIDPEEPDGPWTADGRRRHRALAADLGLREVPPWQLQTPIIGAINGTAIGVGLTLPLQWDIRVAAENADLSFAFCRRGLIPEANSLWILPRLVGLSRALDIMLRGQSFSGTDAERWGLVTEAVPRSRVLPRAREMARDIAENTSPVAVSLTKELVYRFLSQPDRDLAHEEERSAFRWVAGMPDASEGLRAHKERRTPQWQTEKRLAATRDQQV
jgi:enoyl-CoA hydratase/carnithine racemase